MELIQAVSKEMLATIMIIMEVAKKIFPKIQDKGKIIMALIIGALVGLYGFISGDITNVLVAIGLGIFAGAEAAGIWKIVHEVLTQAQVFVIRSIGALKIK